MSNIKYFAFAKVSASVPVYGLVLDKTEEEEIKIEVSKVLTQLKTLEIRVDERQKIKSGYGCWYCKKDHKGIIYLALCSPNYPERHIYAAINLLREHLQKIGDYENQPDSTLKLHCKEAMVDISNKYENLRNIDKVGIAQDMVEDLKLDMIQNAGKIIQNSANMTELQKKSDNLRQSASQFQQSANELEKLMYWRNCKLKIIVGIVVTALIVLIVVPIATKIKGN